MYLRKRGAVPKGATKKAGSIQKLDATLWRVFSEYIRLRDSDDKGNCRCPTCGRVHHWKDMDAGHFVGRRHKATKFCERNVLAQCRYCNRFNQGEQFKMSQAVDARFGAGTAEYLTKLSRAKTKLTALWYEVKTEEYRAKVKEMKKAKV